MNQFCVCSSGDHSMLMLTALTAQGMLDAQLRHLGEVLANKRIWALNVGENFQITNQAWERFTLALEDTAVAYLYVSEQHLKNTDLKIRMRDAVRIHRRYDLSPTRTIQTPQLLSPTVPCASCRAGPARDSEVVSRVGNMWWNPKTSKKRRLTSTEFDRMMAAMKRRCVRHLVLQTQFDDLAKVGNFSARPELLLSHGWCS